MENYLSLGVFDEAKKNAAVLGHNFPNSKWYKHAYLLMKNDDLQINEMFIEETNDEPTSNTDKKPKKEEDESFFSWFNDLFEKDEDLNKSEKKESSQISEN